MLNEIKKKNTKKCWIWQEVAWPFFFFLFLGLIFSCSQNNPKQSASKSQVTPKQEKTLQNQRSNEEFLEEKLAEEKPYTILTNELQQEYLRAEYVTGSLQSSYDQEKNINRVTFQLNFSHSLEEVSGSKVNIVLSDLSLTDAYKNRADLASTVPGWEPKQEEEIVKRKLIFKPLNKNTSTLLELSFSITNLHFSPSPYYFFAFVFQGQKMVLGIKP